MGPALPYLNGMQRNLSPTSSQVVFCSTLVVFRLPRCSKPFRACVPSTSTCKPAAERQAAAPPWNSVLLACSFICWSIFLVDVWSCYRQPPPIMAATIETSTRVQIIRLVLPHYRLLHCMRTRLPLVLPAGRAWAERWEGISMSEQNVWLRDYWIRLRNGVDLGALGMGLDRRGPKLSLIRLITQLL